MISIISVGKDCQDIERFFASLDEQTYQDWECLICVDAGSNADVYALTHKSFRLEAGHENGYRDKHYSEYVHRSNIRRYYMFNFFSMAMRAKGDILATLDLDDSLNTPTALETIAEAYKDKDTWITYGNYKSSDGIHGHWCKELTSEDWQNIRKAPWKTSAMRTFRKELFYKIRPESFIDWDGNWYKRATDRAMMIPMLEMAGPKHVKFIKDYIYYANARPKSERQEEIEYEKRAIEHIRNQTPYERIA